MTLKVRETEEDEEEIIINTKNINIDKPKLPGGFIILSLYFIFSGLLLLGTSDQFTIIWNFIELLIRIYLVILLLKYSKNALNVFRTYTGLIIIIAFFGLISGTISGVSISVMVIIRYIIINYLVSKKDILCNDVWI